MFRLRAELEACKFALFITLTYDDEHFPDKGVNRRDLQLFLKRLRKRLGNRSFRYFITSEYGDNTHRAHYHGLFFFSQGERSRKLYDDIEAAWQNGFLKFGDVEEGSIVYCTKYCLKKTAVPEGCNQTFQIMSKCPGIGYTFLEQYADYYQNTLDYGVAHLHGVSSRMPRYFRDKMTLNYEKDFKYQLECINEQREYQKYLLKFAAYRRRFGQNKTEEEFVKYLYKGRKVKDDLILKHTKKQKF